MDEGLKAQFAAMSDEEMQHLGSQYASLTDDAQTLVREEFKRRNLETPDEEEGHAFYEYRDLKTIRQYRDQPEALLARSVLESAGIDCFLQDDNIVRLVWQNSNLLGGIKLQVAPSDIEAAEAVLSQPIPESIPVVNEPDYDQPRCPKCGSLDSSFFSSNLKAATASLYLVGIPLPAIGPRNYWHCNNCATDWIDEVNARALGNR